MASADPWVLEAVQRLSLAQFSVRHSRSLAHVTRTLRQAGPPDCAVVSSRLGRADGFAVVTALRARRHTLPILLLGSDGELDHANQAYGLQVDFVFAANDLESHLTTFLRRVASTLICREHRLLTTMEAFARAARLSIRETEILAAAESGVPRGRIAETLGIAENTVKTHVRAILRKTKRSSLSEVVWQLRCADREPAEG